MNLLITGGTGFIGHHLAHHFLFLTSPSLSRLVIFSRDEYKQALMAEELHDDPRVRFFLGDVRDRERLDQAFHGISHVVHAAALKRVDSVAYNPEEVFKTNVLGTANVLHAAVRARVSRVLLISSDKACYPTNAYGVSKAMAEALTTGHNIYGEPQGTTSSVVRYGNVLGSRGSVVEMWRSQGDVLTVTDPEATRFFLTPSHAAQLVTGELLRAGGRIVVPILPATTLRQLALAVNPRATLHIIGMRPGGEKAHETLLTWEESARAHLNTCGYEIEEGPESRSYAPFTLCSRDARQMGPEELTRLLRELPHPGGGRRGRRTHHSKPRTSGP